MKRFLFSLLVLLLFVSAASARPAMLERTVLVHDDATQANQIIFLGQHGKTYLWHPSTMQIIPGRWSTRASGSYEDTICLRYGRSDYNPITGTGHPCIKITNLLNFVPEQARGDAFDLSHRSRAPFRLAPGNFSLTALAAKAGVQLTPPIIERHGGRAGDPPPTLQDLCDIAREHEQIFGKEGGTTRMLQLCKNR